MSDETNTDRLVHDGEVRTDMSCTECSKLFVALVDYSIDGRHTLNCPWCSHEHLRVVKDGKITEERWGSSDHSTAVVKPRRVWKLETDVIQMETNSVSEFIRQRWLEKALR